MLIDYVKKNAERIIGEINSKNIEDKTIIEYNKIFECIKNDPKTYLYKGAKGYYYKKKAALRFCIQDRLKMYISQIRAYGDDEDSIRKILSQASFVIDLYENHGRNTGKSPVTTKNPNKSKKASLRRMPESWEDMIFAKCDNYDYKGALAILQLTGARPSEIARGVIVTGDESSDFLEITIRGSKQGKEKRNGQAMRTIKIDMRAQASYGSPKNYLLSQVAYEGYLLVRVNPKRLNDYVRRLAQKIWPRKKNQISPYSYRHQISADLKGEGEGTPPSKIASVLGHRSIESQRNYAGKRQSRGQTHIGEVSCSHPLREPKNSMKQWEAGRCVARDN